MADYEFWLTTEGGTRLSLLDNHLGCTFTRVANERGWLTMRLPESFDTDLISLDRMVQVWRAPTGGRLSLFRTYFTRRWTYWSEDDEQKIEIAGPDFNDLLARRVIAYFANEAETTVADYADDLMADIVTNNLGAGAGTGRIMSRFSVGTSGGAGPTLEKAVAWRNVLEVLQELNKDSRELDDEIFFDVTEAVTPTGIEAEFHTYVNQPRQDLTRLGVLFAQYQGNLRDPVLTFDYSDEANYVYSVGQGVNDCRWTQEIEDVDRSGAAPWNRREALADARNCQTPACITDTGRARLNEGRPRKTLAARLVDVDGCRFGRDWNWGDKVRALYRGFEFDAILRAVSITVGQDGKETVDVQPEFREVL